MRPWGHLAKVYGVKQISVSPMKLDPWKTLPHDWVNVFKRYVVDYWYNPGIPLIAAYLFYDWGKKENTRLNRKDPRQYANDE